MFDLMLMDDEIPRSHMETGLQFYTHAHPLS